MRMVRPCLFICLAGMIIIPQVTAFANSVVSLRVEPRPEGQPLLLKGKDARQQLFVTAELTGGKLQDMTRRVTYRAEPAGIVSVDSQGFLQPVSDGDVVVTAHVEGGPAAELTVRVMGISTGQPINFANQIVPVFTKLQCNGGGCHGKSGGQNGFRLSLLGFEPHEDYEYLVKEGRGRRIFASAPERSLLLTKPTGKSPHGGGKRLEPDSDEYRLIVRWIQQGAPYGSPSDPKVVAIKCLPDARVMDRKGEQQITVVAIYSDGSTEDATRRALFEPNDTQLAEVSTTGLVKTADLAGEVAVMARYQGQVAVFRATVPLGADVGTLPPVKNLIDEEVFAKLKLLGIPASAVCDDNTFLRRVSIDLTGTLPNEETVRSFLADPNPNKRDALVDRLIDTTEYADYFANKWNMVLRNRRKNQDRLSSTYSFYRWIWSSLYENKPYDQFVREIVTASGDSEETPPALWFREVDQTNEQVEDLSQLFLGQRIQCARCHHHPFEKWSQDDYYGLAAFFSRVGRKDLVGGNGPARDRRIFHNDQAGPPQARNDRTGKMLVPAGLGATPLTIPAEEDPRVHLADWMSRKDNPYFAKALVNRYWKHFFARGLVEPEDDMRDTNPPANPQLLQRVADSFVASHFDLKSLVRLICTSTSYQLTSIPNEFNAKDKQNFSRYYPKRLSAEVLYDGFHQVTKSNGSLAGQPYMGRAMQCADVNATNNTYFLKVFGQPMADTACECERSQDANLAQSLHLLNSNDVQQKIGAAGGRAELFANDKDRPTEEKVKELYRWMFSREPDAEEMQVAIAHLEKHKDQLKPGYEDLIWALINTKEFLFNH